MKERTMSDPSAGFSGVLAGIDWDQVRLSLYAKTAADVERALSRPKLTLEDFKALLSPAAEAYLEPLAQRSQRLTEQRFGRTMQFYVPLYLSNLCSNICSYCGFSMHNAIRRTTLDEDQVDAEMAAIKAQGFEHLLLVTGESERKVGMDYFRRMLPRIKHQFPHVSMEVQPLAEEEYAELISLGVDAVLVYQETYHPRTYAEHHLKGRKSDFHWRLQTPDRLGRAGVHKIGLGALIGLEDWRTDSFHVAAHVDYLQRRYWRTRYSISFPRIRPCTGGLQPKSVMTDRQLLQLICAYRLFNPDLELSLSTRESPYLRDHLVGLGITTMSAGSHTQPGGYSQATESALEQFTVSDERTAAEVSAAVARRGYQVVWKDWERVYG